MSAGRRIFCQHVLKHRLFQAELGHQFLQPTVFLGQLLELADLIGFQAGVLLLPAVERLL